MSNDWQADELMILTVIHSHEARRHSYELLARSLALAPRETKAGVGSSS
jgi:hypothetical protein